MCCTEIPLPNEQARLDILKIHANPITKHGEIGKCGGGIFVCDVMVMSLVFRLRGCGEIIGRF